MTTEQIQRVLDKLPTVEYSGFKQHMVVLCHTTPIVADQEEPVIAVVYDIGLTGNHIAYISVTDSLMIDYCIGCDQVVAVIGEL